MNEVRIKLEKGDGESCELPITFILSRGAHEHTSHCFGCGQSGISSDVD
jgi:hypothetical protein